MLLLTINSCRVKNTQLLYYLRNRAIFWSSPSLDGQSGLFTMLTAAQGPVTENNILKTDELRNIRIYSISSHPYSPPPRLKRINLL